MCYSKSASSCRTQALHAEEEEEKFSMLQQCLCCVLGHEHVKVQCSSLCHDFIESKGEFACLGVVGGIVVAVLLALCLCFFLRRKRNKQVGEKWVAAKQQKEQRKQQKKKKASGPWLGFLRRRKGGPGTGQHLPCICLHLLHTLALLQLPLVKLQCLFL